MMSSFNCGINCDVGAPEVHLNRGQLSFFFPPMGPTNARPPPPSEAQLLCTFLRSGFAVGLGLGPALEVRAGIFSVSSHLLLRWITLVDMPSWPVLYLPRTHASLLLPAIGEADADNTSSANMTHFSPGLPYVDVLPPVDVSPPVVCRSPLFPAPRSPPSGTPLPDLAGDGEGGSENWQPMMQVPRVVENRVASTTIMKTRTSTRLVGTEQRSILSKAMIRKISLREGEKSTGRISIVAKTIAKSRLCGVDLGEGEAKLFSAFQNGSV